MKEKEIIEGNKLIAEFMGVKWFMFSTAQHPDGYPHAMSNGHQGYEPLNYHSSWDWQIPVWQKLYNKLKTSKNKLLNTQAKDVRYNNFNNLIHFSPLDSFEMLLDAIEWYNKSKP